MKDYQIFIIVGAFLFFVGLGLVIVGFLFEPVWQDGQARHGRLYYNGKTYESEKDFPIPIKEVMGDDDYPYLYLLVLDCRYKKWINKIMWISRKDK